MTAGRPVADFEDFLDGFHDGFKFQVSGFRFQVSKFKIQGKCKSTLFFAPELNPGLLLFAEALHFAFVFRVEDVPLRGFEIFP